MQSGGDTPTTEPLPATPSRRTIFLTRAVSAVLLAPVMLAAVSYGTPWFGLLVGAAGVLMAWEWLRIVAAATPAPSVGPRSAWIVAGLGYVALAVLALIWVRNDPVAGRLTTFWLVAVVWATDIGAYVLGSLIGGPKLAPRISPGKTWAGTVGGLMCGVAVGGVTVMLEDRLDLAIVLAWSAGVSLVCQAGDLSESGLKRLFGVKDSGRLIPGHGGMLDRMDGMMAAALVIAAVGLASGGSVLSW